MRHRAKFRGDTSSCCWNITFQLFSNWWPSAILNWLYACLDHPRKVSFLFGGLCRYAKFVWNWCRSFDNMQVLIFCELSLKIFIHAPNGNLGEITPNGEQPHRGPKKVILKRITLYDSLIVKIGPPVRAGRNPKNKVKRKNVDSETETWKITCSSRPPTLAPLACVVIPAT